MRPTKEEKRQDKIDDLKEQLAAARKRHKAVKEEERRVMTMVYQLSEKLIRAERRD